MFKTTILKLDVVEVGFGLIPYVSQASTEQFIAKIINQVEDENGIDFVTVLDNFGYHVLAERCTLSLISTLGSAFGFRRIGLELSLI